MHNLKDTYQQELLKAQLEMQEQMFRNVSWEIHDNIGQLLSLIRLGISTIKAEEDSPSKRIINSSKELLDKVIEDLRDLSKKSNMEYVSQQSLAELLRFQLRLIQRTDLYITTLEVHGEERQLDPEKKLIISWIVQEALNNIIKHTSAKNISIVLMYLSKKIVLSIEDDGHGLNDLDVFNRDETLNEIGTNIMYHRAMLIGAKFSVQNTLGKSSFIKIMLPTE